MTNRGTSAAAVVAVQEQDADSAAAIVAAVADGPVTGGNAPRQVTLSTGRVIDVLGVPLDLLRRLEERFPEPPVPRVRIEPLEGSGEVEPTWEENPNDPDWIAECARVRAAKNDAAMDLALLKGVQCEVPADDGWLEDMDALGLPRPDCGTASKRRLAYLRLELLRSTDDLLRTVQAIYRLTSPSEEGIAAAAARFPRDLPRR